VVALAPMVDLVGEAPLPPAVDFVEGPPAVGDDLPGSIGDDSDGVLFKAGIENDHDFVLPHQRLVTSLWTRPYWSGLRIIRSRVSVKRRAMLLDLGDLSLRAPRYLRRCRSGWPMHPLTGV